MKSFPSGCLAVMGVFLALLFGAGGGCFLGMATAPEQGSDYKFYSWLMNGALIGGAAGLVGGLVGAFVLVRKRMDRSDEDDR